MDRGVTLTAHDAAYLSDTWALNTDDPRTIHANATLRNTMAEPVTGNVVFSVVDIKSGAVLASRKVPATVAANSTVDVSDSLTAASANIWSLDSPNLYYLRATFTANGKEDNDARTVRFGFRSFEVRGIGADAGLYLNGKRIRIYTAISWGFWGLNGLWPTPELAHKEVVSAKSLGLNALNFHRNIGKEEVFNQQDQMGLLRYMEPGGGGSLLDPSVAKYDPAPKGPFDTSGQGGAPGDFLQRYTAEKVLRMVKMFRSHPSLMIYVVQNEIEPLVSNPKVWYILRAMHQLDPSRIVVAKSGIGPLHEAWFEPYSQKALYDDGTGYSGWRDEHTVGGPGVWIDDLYKDPKHYTHQIDDPKEIVEWGEMLGSPSVDHND
jgi:beta-galactosidase/beta-glucuronidase